VKNCDPTVTTSDHQRHVEVASRRQKLKLVVVSDDLKVVLDSIDHGEHDFRLLLSDDRTRFRGNVENVVRTLIEECSEHDLRHSRIAFVDAQRLVRVTQLNGSRGTLFAVTIEYHRGSDSLSRAARKYQLTPREIDVLAMILEGASASETAQALKIAETTVQGYYKRLLSKTQSRNRPAMVANVLGWTASGEGPPRRIPSVRQDDPPLPAARRAWKDEPSL
jgi:DNA-binding CsgD family transcriptional regulator